MMFETFVREHFPRIFQRIIHVRLLYTRPFPSSVLQLFRRR